MVIKNPHALLDRLIAERAESAWLEFKQNNGDPEMIGRCVSACANGAVLVGKERAFIAFGIENGTRKKVGTCVRLSEMTKGAENFQNWLTRMLEPRLMLEFLDFEQDGLCFSIISIEPSYDRPIRFAGSEYVRVGENVKPLRDLPEQERALWLATSRHRFESAIALTHQSAEQVLEILDTSAYYSLTGKEPPKSADEIIRQFSTMGCIKDDSEGGYDITNLGAVLFARDLTSFPSVSNKSVRLIKYVGGDKSKSEREIESRNGYAVSFAGLIGFIRDQVPMEEQYVDGVRRATPIFPMIAVREVIANALIHQDFTVSGTGPMVEIYQDRIEVINPGNSLIAVDRIIDERRSRNEKLASTMRELGICEERGGGIDKAILEIEERSLPAPEFFASENSMRVVLFGPKPFNKLSKADKIWACFCHCVVRWLGHDYMNNTTLRARFKLTPAEYQAASTVISDAKKAGRIVPADEGQGNKYARYVPYWVR
ncbi:ATP-binding protein [Peristeroidobacter soli]|uniref:ATP-binding protein n=1 Tax=Peristeroidobacter soli TaxID=2497877 RepID=UPI00101D344E|nr:ATP-binding protein [Peristeroidobacter soli]